MLVAQNSRARKGDATLFIQSCCVPHPQIHTQSCQACQFHQGIQAELVDSAPQQIVEPGLGDAELFGFLALINGQTQLIHDLSRQQKRIA